MTHAFCLAVSCFNVLAFFVSITCVDLVSHVCFVRINNGFLFCFDFNLLCIWMLRQNVTQDHKIYEPLFVSLITCYHDHLQFSCSCMISTRSNFPATEQTNLPLCSRRRSRRGTQLVFCVSLLVNLGLTGKSSAHSLSAAISDNGNPCNYLTVLESHVACMYKPCSNFRAFRSHSGGDSVAIGT